MRSLISKTWALPLFLCSFLFILQMFFKDMNYLHYIHHSPGFADNCSIFTNFISLNILVWQSQQYFVWPNHFHIRLSVTYDPISEGIKSATPSLLLSLAATTYHHGNTKHRENTYNHSTLDNYRALSCKSHTILHLNPFLINTSAAINK